MAEALWYYEDAGKPAGPVSEAALAEAIRQGRLTRGQRVWTAGQSGWVAWEALPALAALAPPEPAIAPTSPATTPSGWSPPEAPPTAGGWSPPPATSAGAAAPPGLYPRAPPWPRIAAALLDGLIGSGPFAVVALLLGGTSAIGAGGEGALSLLGALAVATGLWALYYSFTKDGRPGGQSIGKRTMRLMVVHLPTNRPCTTAQSALRAMVLLVLQLVPYVGWLVEPIAVLAVAGGRRLGDQAAGTQVILASDWRPPR